ncbi:hypothetical protein FKM82_001584 [Ascaphus truei]
MVFVPKSRMADAARWLEPFAQIQDGRPRRQCFGDGVFIPGLSSMVVNSIRLLPFLTIRLIVCIMASSLSGMFPSQPPVPPPIPPGSATGLMATPPGPKNPNVTLVDELESSFEGLINAFRSFWTLPDKQNVFSYKKDYSFQFRSPSKLLKR